MKTLPLNQMMPLKAQANARPDKADTAEEKKLKESARELEGLFISFVLKAMEKTIPREKEQNNLATMMFSSVMGKEMAEQGGFGLADYLYQRLSEKDLTAIERLKGQMTGDARFDVDIKNNSE